MKPVKDSRVSKGRALLDTCADTPKGIRDAAIISIMYTTGAVTGNETKEQLKKQDQKFEKEAIYTCMGNAA